MSWWVWPTVPAVLMEPPAFSLMAVRFHVQEPQIGQQAPAAQFAAPDVALQQQLAAQGRLPGEGHVAICL